MLSSGHVTWSGDTQPAAPDVAPPCSWLRPNRGPVKLNSLQGRWGDGQAMNFSFLSGCPQLPALLVANKCSCMHSWRPLLPRFGSPLSSLHELCLATPWILDRGIEEAPAIDGAQGHVPNLAVATYCHIPAQHGEAGVAWVRDGQLATSSTTCKPLLAKR